MINCCDSFISNVDEIGNVFQRYVGFYIVKIFTMNFCVIAIFSDNTLQLITGQLNVEILCEQAGSLKKFANCLVDMTHFFCRLCL